MDEYIDIKGDLLPIINPYDTYGLKTKKSRKDYLIEHKLYDNESLVNEYNLIQEKKSNYSASIRRMIIEECEYRMNKKLL